MSLWGRMPAALVLVTVLVVVGATVAAPSSVSAEGLWNDVARAPTDEAARERREAQRELSVVSAQGDRRSAEAAARAEAHLRRAVRLCPGDFESRRQLAEFLAATDRARDAVAEFRVASQMAPSSTDRARMLFRTANELSRLGAYDRALDAYARQLALGDLDSAALGNAGELAMAAGRLGEAIDRYQEAVAIDERDRGRRERVQPLALGYFGLAVALDRADRAVASAEAMSQALALDPGLAVLRLAEQGGRGDLFFVPPGDVFYYLALARRAQGRADDAAAAFRNYLHVASGPYVGRARAHLAELASHPQGDAPAASRRPPAMLRPRAPEASAADGGRGPRWRVVHEATLVSDGPIVAPLIDAAWRLDRRLLDDCLREFDGAVAQAPAGISPAMPTTNFRLSLDLRLDETGAASAVSVHLPVGVPDSLGACIETAVRTRLRVTRPTRRRPTRARIELVLAPAESSGL